MTRINDRVLARRADEFFYPGTVRHQDGPRFAVQFDDGEDGWMTEAELLPLRFEVGDRVQARMPGGRAYTAGQVLRVEGDRLNLEYDDGFQEMTSLGMVRVDRRDWKAARSSAPAHRWIVGDRVLGRWGDGFWYPGTIQTVAQEQLDVCFLDGDRSWLTLDQVKPLELEVGSRVFGRWKLGPIYYPGKITARNEDRIRILYDDGDQEDTTIQVVRLLFSDPQTAQLARVGQRVLAQWLPEPFFYPGEVRGVHAEVLEIVYDDGDRGQVLLNQVLPLKFTVGMRVFARKQKGMNYYPASLSRQSGNDLLVIYEDGQQEWTTLRAIRVLPEDVAK